MDTNNVDQTAETPEKATALSRACARGAAPSETSAVEIDSQNESVSGTELEAIACAIENAPPNANETVGSIIALHPKVRRAIVAAAVRALGARKWWYDSKKKRRVEEPDYSLSFKAAEFLADRVDGRPAQAVMNLNVNAHQDTAEEGPEEFQRKLEESPALRDALRRKLERAERHALSGAK